MPVYEIVHCNILLESPLLGNSNRCHNVHYCLEPYNVTNTKINRCQYVIFIKPINFDTTNIKCFTVDHPQM